MTKWIFNNWQKIILLYIGYFIVWYIGWQLSVNFETIADITSWFLPAGIRVTSLLLFNKKYWPVIALAEYTGIYVVNSSSSPFTTSLGTFIGTFPPILIYMLCLYFYLKTSIKIQFDSVQNLIRLFIWSGIGATVTATLLVSSLMFQGQVQPENYFKLLFHLC